MSEYIITDEQFKTATEAYLEHELSRPITEVFISGEKLPEIVRCRDCMKWHHIDTLDGVRYGECDEWKRADSYCVPATRENGFCAWATCKCGEDIETNGCEWVVCPSCGRMIRV